MDVIFTYNFLAEDVDHYYDDVMYIQKVTLSGQTLWGEMGKKITRDFTDYTLVPNNLGGAYLLNDGNSYDEAKVYGWNFNAQGNNLWQSDIILEMPCSYLYLINVLADGAGNIILNLMLKDSPESDWYSHLIKLSPEGNIIGNNPLLPQSQFSGLYQIHSDRNGNYVLWKVIDSNLTLQKMDPRIICFCRKQLLISIVPIAKFPISDFVQTAVYTIQKNAIILLIL